MIVLFGGLLSQLGGRSVELGAKRECWLGVPQSGDNPATSTNTETLDIADCAVITRCKFCRGIRTYYLDVCCVAWCWLVEGT